MTGAGSGKVINLRVARKSAARDAARRQGDANAAKFGRSRSQKLSQKDAEDRAARHLDAHRIVPDWDGDAGGDVGGGGDTDE